MFEGGYYKDENWENATYKIRANLAFLLEAMWETLVSIEITDDVEVARSLDGVYRDLASVAFDLSEITGNRVVQKLMDADLLGRVPA